MIGFKRIFQAEDNDSIKLFLNGVFKDHPLSFLSIAETEEVDGWTQSIIFVENKRRGDVYEIAIRTKLETIFDNNSMFLTRRKSKRIFEYFGSKLEWLDVSIDHLLIFKDLYLQPRCSLNMNDKEECKQ